MKHLLLLCLLAFSVRAETATRVHKTSNEVYIVEFEYSTGSFSVPATNPPGQPHYDALVTIFKVTDGKMVKVGKRILGTYTEKGCFEDNPDFLLAKVLEAKEDYMPWRERAGQIIVLTNSGTNIFIPITLTNSTFIIQ